MEKGKKEIFRGNKGGVKGGGKSGGISTRPVMTN